MAISWANSKNAAPWPCLTATESQVRHPVPSTADKIPYGSGFEKHIQAVRLTHPEPQSLHADMLPETEKASDAANSPPVTSSLLTKSIVCMILTSKDRKGRLLLQRVYTSFFRPEYISQKYRLEWNTFASWSKVGSTNTTPGIQKPHQLHYPFNYKLRSTSPTNLLFANQII